MNTWADEKGVLELPDGRRVRGAAARQLRGAVPAPDFAVYLLGRPPRGEQWPYRWVRWRDFRLPDSTEDAVSALAEAHVRALDQRVAIACGGGVGRTGAALALLAVMSGLAPEHAIAWARVHHHRRAVETRKQRHWVEMTAASLRTQSKGIRGSP